MSDKRYRVAEIFYSVQGEGSNAGMACGFVRLAGCNLHCSKDREGFDCDTIHEPTSEMTADEIVAELEKIMPRIEWEGYPWGGRVVVTGGEPLIQYDPELEGALKCASIEIHLETNGTIQMESTLAPDWVVMSPKKGHDIKLEEFDYTEQRLVLTAGEKPWREPELGVVNTVSPVFNGDRIDRNSLAWCIAVVKDDPRWRLSVQQHKGWGVR